MYCNTISETAVDAGNFWEVQQWCPTSLWWFIMPCVVLLSIASLGTAGMREKCYSEIKNAGSFCLWRMPHCLVGTIFLWLFHPESCPPLSFTTLRDRDEDSTGDAATSTCLHIIVSAVPVLWILSLLKHLHKHMSRRLAGTLLSYIWVIKSVKHGCQCSVCMCQWLSSMILSHPDHRICVIT